jgi:hypothetical protein
LQFRVTKKDVEDVLSGNVFDKLFKSNFMFWVSESKIYHFHTKIDTDKQQKLQITKISDFTVTKNNNDSN